MENNPIIRTQGNIIQLMRFKIVYSKPDFENPDRQIEMTEYAHTKDEADRINTQYNGTITLIDTTGQEWIDGISVGDTNMPYDRALEFVAMGEQGYKAYIEQEKKRASDVLLKENDALKQQVTDLQFALAELYETMTANMVKG